MTGNIEIKEKSIEDIINDKYLDKYWNIDIKKINNNIYAISTNKRNIAFFVDSKGDVILSITSIAEFKNIETYFQKLWVKEEKDEQWVYHMYCIDNEWKKKEVDKYSEEYFDIWMSIWFILGRDVILKTYEWDTKNTIYKIPDKTLEFFIKDKSIRLMDFVVLKQKGNITKEQFIKYHKQLQWLLLEQIWDTRFWLLDNNSTITINNKYGNFHLDTSKVTISEIEFLYKLKIISGNIYKLAMEKLEELERLEERKQIEINKQIWEGKKAIRGL